MRLLICTQKVDKDDPILGFFHRWIIEFVKYFEHILVICLEEGTHDLPDTVQVVSLGKEKKRSRLQYVSRFYRYINAYRDQYDVVFVHMNPEYVVLGGPLWRLWGKRVGLWYNHTHGTFLTRVGMLFAHSIFHTSPYAYTAGTKKSKRMPAGIDTTIFTVQETVEQIPASVLYIGRLSPIKHVDVLLQAIQLLPKKVAERVVLDVYGSAPEGDEAYEKRLRLHTGEQQNGTRVTFYGSVPNTQTPSIYNTHSIFVNLTPPGNYDKTVLEAMACGMLTIVSSKAFRGIIPETLYTDLDAQRLSETIERVYLLPPHDKETMRHELQNHVIKNESLTLLAKTIFDLL